MFSYIFFYLSMFVYFVYLIYFVYFIYFIYFVYFVYFMYFVYYVYFIYYLHIECPNAPDRRRFIIYIDLIYSFIICRCAKACVGVADDISMCACDEVTFS